MSFIGFPKIPRLSKLKMRVTEKIDGTNAQIFIEPWDAQKHLEKHERFKFYFNGIDYYFRAGSRVRWVQPENDNFGFAKWAFSNVDSLLTLGPGRHFGEWWGQGIQRGYGMKTRKLSLFDSRRWDGSTPERTLPALVSTVPILADDELFHPIVTETIMKSLEKNGSVAAPGYPHPEGICIEVAGVRFKQTFGPEERTGKDKQKDKVESIWERVWHYLSARAY